MTYNNNDNNGMIWGWAIAAGVVSFVIMKFMLSYAFWPALILALLIMILVAILVWLGFSGSKTTVSEAPVAASSPAPAPKPVEPESAPAPKPASAPATEAQVDYDGDGVLEGDNEGTKPAGLDGPRGGTADDLKKIKGVGPKLEKLLNSMGFYHYDQVAGWSADEVAWVNANLAGFKGRVTRDNWIEQAKTLAAGGDTAFSKKVDKGGVY